MGKTGVSGILGALGRKSFRMDSPARKKKAMPMPDPYRSTSPSRSKTESGFAA